MSIFVIMSALLQLFNNKFTGNGKRFIVNRDENCPENKFQTLVVEVIDLYRHLGKLFRLEVVPDKYIPSI